MFELCAQVAALLLSASQLPLSPCELTHPGVPIRMKALCGSFSTAEDPARPAGKQIRLRVGVLKATGTQPAPDAIFLLAGGPGQAATEAWVAIADVFSRAQRTRDVVLVDQRGTGGSNPLDCDAGSDLTLPHDLESMKRETKRCLDQLQGDPRFYTTTIAMEDLERVRVALGYEQIDLVGVSYGTRAALTYLRLHPDRVRSMVLQGVVPTELPLGLDHADNLDRALDLHFDRCAHDPACAARFPDLRGSLDALIARVDSETLRIQLPDPRSGESIAVTVDRPFFAAGIRFLAYVPETAAVIPLLIHEAHQTGRIERLAAQSAIVARQIEGAISSGMELSVICAEDVPLYPRERAPSKTLLGDELIKAAAAQCEVWPRGEMPADFHAPVVSDVPSLLISGDLDPVTPPSGAEKVKRHLSRSRHLVVRGQGHMMARGCMDRVLDDFLTHRDPEVDAGCLDTSRAPPFFVRLTGPEP